MADGAVGQYTEDGEAVGSVDKEGVIGDSLPSCGFIFGFNSFLFLDSGIGAVAATVRLRGEGGGSAMLG